MGVRGLKRILPIAVILGFCGLATPAAAEPVSADNLCAPSEATDPQPLHINGSKPFVYKTVGNAELRLHVFSLAGRKAGTRSPAVLFFYGGGWVFGDIRRFQAQATHLALRGLVTVLVDYRVKCRHGSTIADSVADAKSAMRWIRSRADQFGIDPARIAVVGSSAGGHLAATTALVPDLDEPADKQVDPKPDALILYNPALDTASTSALAEIKTFVGKDGLAGARESSPIDHLRKGLPPTIIFQGTADKLVAPATADRFCTRAKTLGSQCEVVRYPGAPHGFTEIWMGLDEPSLAGRTEQWAADTSRRTDAFLTGLGWMTATANPSPPTPASRRRKPSNR